MAKLFRLDPGFAVGRLGDQYFFYDANVGVNRLPRYRTQPIAKSLYDVLRILADNNESLTLDEVHGRVAGCGQYKKHITTLRTAGILRPAAPSTPASRRPEPGSSLRFREDESYRLARTSTFFNLPTDLSNKGVKVGLKGVPLASHPQNEGTEAAPAYLRHLSREFGTWFSICDGGVYSDFCARQGDPIICEGTVIKDFGDFDFDDDTLRAIFKAIESSVKTEFLRPGIKPIFIGGDHAVTFPIVHAYKKAIPNLGLLHLDAHHDLFYGDQVSFSHASVIGDLLFHSEVDPVFSFGIRTKVDARGKTARRVLSLPQTRLWLERASTIDRCRALLSDPSAFDAMFADHIDTPYFLTIDLDVLAPAALGRKVLTPSAGGLQWAELYRLLGMFFDRLDIVGCDITELNPYLGGESPDANESLVCLLLLLIERLGR